MKSVHVIQCKECKDLIGFSNTSKTDMICVPCARVFSMVLKDFHFCEEIGLFIEAVYNTFSVSNGKIGYLNACANLTKLYYLTNEK